jgi:hypothetical protein
MATKEKGRRGKKAPGFSLITHILSSLPEYVIDDVRKKKKKKETNIGSTIHD